MNLEPFEQPDFAAKIRAALDMPDEAAVSGLRTELDRAIQLKGVRRSSTRRSAWPLWLRTVRPPLVLAAALLVATGVALAVTGVVNLGKPTNDQPWTGPKLYAFRPVSVVHKQGRVTVHLFDTLWDAGSAEMRWPLAKALEQFGQLTGVQKGAANQRFARGRLPGLGPVPPVPTLDLSRATYQSAYVAFVHRVVQVHPHTPLVSLPTAEQGLFDKARHVRPAGSAPDVYSFPVVVVGGYGAHGPIEDPSVLVYPSVAGTATRYQTYEDIQHLMVAGKGQFWVREFNAYANVVTALICYQDGFRPKAVCDRPVVRAILKGAK